MSAFNSINTTVYSKSSYIGSLELLEYIIFIIIIYKYNPFTISSKYQSALTLFVALIYVLLFYFLREKISLGQDADSPISEFTFLIKVLSTIAFFLVSIFLVKYIAIFISTGAFNMFRYFIFFSAIVAGLAILYTMFKPAFNLAKNSKSGSIPAFLFKLIMYTPCLLLSIIDYFKYEYNITTKPIWILLLVELVLIVLFFIVPLLLHSYATKNGVQLLKEPKYLNNENILGTFDELYGKDVNIELDSADNSKPKFNYHYSLSAWFYINPQPPSTSPAYNKYTNILNYGSKPTIEFNSLLNSLRITIETEQEPNGNKKTIELFETKKVLFQRWNNIVINYDRGTMDVFLNGELVGSRPGIAPYMTYESIGVGANNGIQGGISNVIYYKDNLTRSYIELMYQALKGRAEPFL
jgi:hypothetical protein